MKQAMKTFSKIDSFLSAADNLNRITKSRRSKYSFFNLNKKIEELRILFKTRLSIQYLYFLSLQRHMLTHKHTHLLWSRFQGLCAKMERKIYIGNQYYWQWKSTLHSKCSNIIEQVACFELLSKLVDLCSSMSNLNERCDKYVDEEIRVVKLCMLSGVLSTGRANKKPSMYVFILLW